MFRDSKRVEHMSGQYLRNRRLAMDCYQVQSSLNRGHQDMFESVSFEDSLRCLKAKLDFITLKVQLDTITNMLEQCFQF